MRKVKCTKSVQLIILTYNQPGLKWEKTVPPFYGTVEECVYCIILHRCTTGDVKTTINGMIGLPRRDIE
jgi:hypothetical protein